MGARRTYRPWTTAEQRLLCEMYGAGQPYAAIARALIRSERSVRGRGAELGLRSRRSLPWTAVELATLAGLRASRLPVQEIAARLGRPLGGVAAQLRRLRLVATHRRWTATDDRELMRLAGWPHSAVASRLGRSPGAVAARRRLLRDAPARRPAEDQHADYRQALSRRGEAVALSAGRWAIRLRARLHCPDCAGIVAGDDGPSIPCHVAVCQWRTEPLASEPIREVAALDALRAAIEASAE